MGSNVSSRSVDQDNLRNNESGEEDEEEAYLAILKSEKSFTQSPVFQCIVHNSGKSDTRCSQTVSLGGFMREDPSLDRNCSYNSSGYIYCAGVCVCVCVCMCMHACVCVCVFTVNFV